MMLRRLAGIVLALLVVPIPFQVRQIPLKDLPGELVQVLPPGWVDCSFIYGAITQRKTSKNCGRCDSGQKVLERFFDKMSFQVEGLPGRIVIIWEAIFFFQPALGLFWALS